MGISCGKIGASSPKSNTKLKEENKVTPFITVLPDSKQKIENETTLIVQKESLVLHKELNPVESQYQLMHKLGSGSYATVYMVKHILTNTERAMKKIFKEQKLKQEILIKKENEILNEIEILKSIDHPNIVKIIELYSTPEYYYLITELCQGGQIFNQFEKYCPFDEFHAAYIMYQLFLAVHYCHLKKIVHRDIKPQNILIDKVNNNGYFIIKVIDFGTAKLFKKDKLQKTLTGSPYYIAPEVLNGSYNEKCDLWSCGVLLYTLMTGKLPFIGEDANEVFEKIKEGKYDINIKEFDKLSSEAKDLIRQLLILDPEKRISLTNVFKHRFFVNKKMKEYVCGLSKEKILSCLKNIKDYKSEFALQTTVLAFLVHNFTHHIAVKDVNNFFNVFDYQIEQADGKLTRQEVIRGLAKFMSKSDVIKNVDSIFTKIDRDCNGFIEYEEFVGACIDKNIFLNSNILQHAFNFFDRDNSGFIDLHELEEVFCNGKKKTDELRKSLKDIIRSVDINRDGAIDIKEFTLMMEKIIRVN